MRLRDVPVGVTVRKRMWSNEAGLRVVHHGGMGCVVEDGVGEYWIRYIDSVDDWVVVTAPPRYRGFKSSLGRWWRRNWPWLASTLLLVRGVAVLRPTDPTDLTDWRLWLGWSLAVAGVHVYAWGRCRSDR